MGRYRYVVLGAYLAFYLSWQALHWLPLTQATAGDLVLEPLALAATAAAWMASRRAAGTPRLRSAWRWIALGLAGQSAGGISQFVYEHVLHQQAYPTLTDALYLSFYPLMLVGIVRFPSMPRRGRAAVDLALDCAIAALGGSAVFVYFIVGPSAVAGGSTLATITTLAYPVGDMVLLVGLGTALLRTPLPVLRASLRLMAIALGLFIAADLIYGYVVLHGGYQGGDPLDALYGVAFACFVLAAWRQPAVAPGDAAARGPRAAVSTRVNWLPYVGIAVCLAVLVKTDWGEPLASFSIALLIIAVTALAVVRQLRSLARVRQSHERLAEAQRLAQLGSWEWDVECDRFEVSDEELRLLGHRDHADAATHATALRAIHPDDRERVRQIVRESLDTGRPFACEMRIVLRDGAVRTLLARGDAQLHDGRVVRMHGTHQDISDRKRMESELAYQADHDSLTGLHNRRRFRDELERVLRYAARNERPGAILMLDVDNFKLVNDAHGLATGDAALKSLGETIVAHTHGTDVVGRIGGDEFAIALPEAGEDEARAAAAAIRASLARRDDVSPITVSAGVALFDGTHELGADDALAAADIALYEAKEGGRDQVRVYHGEAGAALTWVERIRRALDEDRFVLFAQPILDLADRRVARHELLVRMLSEDGEVIGPGAFLPTAERFGLIGELDRWVVREGLALARAGKRVSINLSAASIGDERILDAVRAAVVRDVRADDVIFEITETAVMTNMRAARDFAAALTELGCAVALDDFGTGFGSFSYLKHLPTRYLKIDMEFVRELVWNTTDQQVVKSIAAIARGLGKRTIGEGVEDRATLEALQALGVDCAQGYHVGRPERVSPPTRFERRPPSARTRARTRRRERTG
jgi:diguanylate cyclase (GGDEF)-like protein/PAS domain S-box-containing protein